MNRKVDHEDTGDLALLESLGDEPGSMREFYDKYGPQVFRYALSVLRNTHAADEVLQETMIAIWRSGQRFSGKSRISTWVYSVCHNKIIDYVRRESKHDQRARCDMCRPDDASCWDGSGPPSAQAQDIEFWEAFHSLPEEQQETILLFYDAGFSVAEVSQILSIPEGTVRSRLYLGKKRLKEVLKDK